MFVNEIHKFVKFLKNEGQNIYHSPEQLDDVINRASLDLFRQEEKIFESQQIVTDTLGAFKMKYSPILNVNGTYALPTDYVRLTNLSYNFDNVTVNPYLPEEPFTFCDTDYVDTNAVSTVLSDLEHPIKLLVDAEWVNRQRSSFLKIDESDPIARIYGRNIEVLPKTITPIMYYLRKPIKGVWAYTVSGDGYSTIFDVNNSTDIDFPEISHNEIIEKVMSLLGVPVRDGMLSQFEQMQKRNNE